MERDGGVQPSCIPHAHLPARPLGEDRPWSGDLSPFRGPHSAPGTRCLHGQGPLPRGKQLQVPTFPPRINPGLWPSITVQEGCVGWLQQPLCAQISCEPCRACLLGWCPPGEAGCCLARPSSCPNSPPPPALPSPRDPVPSHQDVKWRLVCALLTSLPFSSPVLLQPPSGGVILRCFFAMGEATSSTCSDTGEGQLVAAQGCPSRGGRRGQLGNCCPFLFTAASTVLGWSVWESLGGEAGGSVKIK